MQAHRHASDRQGRRFSARASQDRIRATPKNSLKLMSRAREMSATYKISKSQSAQYAVVKNGGSSAILSASELRQLCQTMGESYAHLMAELAKNDVVELTIGYGRSAGHQSIQADLIASLEKESTYGSVN